MVVEHEHFFSEDEPLTMGRPQGSIAVSGIVGAG